MFQKLAAILFVASFSGPNAFAANPVSLRWTAADDANAELAHILEVAGAKTGFALKATDFLKIEDLDLATSHFQYLAEESAGVPIQGMALRIWTDLKTGGAIQVEAQLVSPAPAGPASHILANALAMTQNDALRAETLKVMKQELAQHEDHQIRGLSFKDYWVPAGEGRELVRDYRVRGSRGLHRIWVSLQSRKVVHHDYSMFPKADQIAAGGFSIPAQVYPIYEIANNGKTESRVAGELKYLNPSVPRVTADPYASLRARTYLDSKEDPVLGMTEAGRAQGYWSISYLKQQAKAIRDGIATTANAFGPNGVLLNGRYCTVSLYPDVAKMQGLSFTPGISPQLFEDWEPVEGSQNSYQLIPTSALLGKPLLAADEASKRPANIYPDNSPVKYLNDGFDELQVYYAVTTLFENLNLMGFTDPELSTRPMNAFLYDTDISMADNAFYTDDTINFTTYSPGQPNDARDNSTIWHELGHGVMDRLMGDEIHLADTGGLSEGMADFVAALVIASVTNAQPFDGSDGFRIVNNTLFYVTDEVHDDGEAYGGSMRDLLYAAIGKWGRDGIMKVGDLTMETMRLTRDHPALTAPDWFGHMLFADQLGRAGVRAPNELHDLILNAVGSRNFTIDGKKPALFHLKKGSDEIVAGGPGSRDHEIQLTLGPDETASYFMSAQLESGEEFKWPYPLEVRVNYTSGALEGPIHWSGEDSPAQVFTLNSDQDVAQFQVTATGKCDSVNRADGSCSDYAYVQIWSRDPDAKKPIAKKRFYLRIHPKAR